MLIINKCFGRNNIFCSSDAHRRLEVRRFQKISEDFSAFLNTVFKKFPIIEGKGRQFFSMNLKIKITLETSRLLLLRRPAVTVIWCAECESETHFAAENEINDVLPEPETSAQAHKIMNADGKVLVCLESLLKQAK
jgi:hypothetical protein